MVTQDNKAPSTVSPPMKRRSKRTNQSVSPRTIGIAVTALQKFMGNAFLEEIRKTIKSNDVIFDQEEMEHGVVRSVTKQTITKYKSYISDPITQ